MRLYNTLTRQIEDIKPLNPSGVTVYTCGPTVYDYAHIGHWFNYIRMDTLIRTLKIAGLQSTWVMNITDVGHLVSDADDGEDKLEKGARREGKSAWEVADFYTKDFLTGMRQLNMLHPDHTVKATEHIAEQIVLIKKLESKGFTYVIHDGVYYDTNKFEDYATFAQLDLDEQRGSGRVAVNKEKRNPSDFALWKFSPKNQKRDMEWDSPWGRGFPGWHIECSAMSMKYLGDTIDIHTGGIDHIPVHHTNEIAQSEGATGKRFANMWMHGNHVMVRGEKISKSLNNGIRLQDIEKRGISPMAVRLHVLESHYRNQATFSWESLKAAENRLLSYRAFADLRFQPIMTGDYEIDELDYSVYLKIIRNALLDDLATPKALANLSLLADARQDRILTEEMGELKAFLKFIDEALGLKLLESNDITKEQKLIITERETARTAKDWSTSDELRQNLLEQGIAVRDTEQGPIWSRL